MTGSTPDAVVSLREMFGYRLHAARIDVGFLAAAHPGVDVDDVLASTGWDLHVSDELAATDPPTARELDILRRLEAVA